jgi:hypothetical protein
MTAHQQNKQRGASATVNDDTATAAENRNFSLFCETADAIPVAKVALVCAHIVDIGHAGHLEAAGPVQAQEGGASVVGDAVRVDPLVRLQGVATVA